jgi:hypothetical protein
MSPMTMYSIMTFLVEARDGAQVSRTGAAEREQYGYDHEIQHDPAPILTPHLRVPRYSAVCEASMKRRPGRVAIP